MRPSARPFASDNRVFSAPAQSPESLRFLCDFETRTIATLSVVMPRRRRSVVDGPLAPAKRPQARSCRRMINAGSASPAQAAGTGRWHAQVTPSSPSAGCDTQPALVTHVSIVQGSPSSHPGRPSTLQTEEMGPPLGGIVVVGAAPPGTVVVVVALAPVTRIGGVRAMTMPRLANRSSYQPGGASAATSSGRVPAAVVPVKRKAAV